MAVRPLREDERIIQSQPANEPAPARRVRPLREDETIKPPEGGGGFPIPGASSGGSGEGFPSPGEFAKGVGETGLTFATGIVAVPTAGLVGIGSTIYDAIVGNDDPVARAAERIEAIQEKMTFQPRSREGQALTQHISEPLQVVQETAGRAGQAVLDRTGSPLAATAAHTLIEAAPMALGARTQRGVTGQQRRADVADVEKRAEQTGVDIDAAPQRQREQVQAGAERERGTITERAESIPNLQETIKAAREAQRKMVNQLYEQARRTKAGLPVENAVTFEPIVRSALKRFDVEDMPIVQRRLAELESIRNLPAGTSVRLNAVDTWRQRLNRNRPPKTDATQNAAIDVMRAQLDNFIDAQFNADMITGNPAAIARWQEARGASARYKELFKDDKVIRQLAEQQATPETMRAWIFGASAAGAKTEAAAVVRKLKDILGSDSPQLTALRQDALLDIMNPILRREPDFAAFVKNYDNIVRKNPSLVKELFPDSETGLKSLRDFAASAERMSPSRRMVDLNRTAAVVLFGHGLAKGALRVTMARQAFELLRSAGGRTRRRQVMSEILGYDALAPMIPVTPAVIGGSTQTGSAIEQPEEGTMLGMPLGTGS